MAAAMPWTRRGYKLEDGRIVEIGGKGKEAMPVAFQERLKASACGRFKTILGPGSDGYHEEHLHVDLQPRRSNTALCHWAVRDMNTPKPALPMLKPSSRTLAKTEAVPASGDAPSDAAAPPGRREFHAGGNAGGRLWVEAARAPSPRQSRSPRRPNPRPSPRRPSPHRRSPNRPTPPIGQASSSHPPPGNRSC